MLEKPTLASAHDPSLLATQLQRPTGPETVTTSPARLDDPAAARYEVRKTLGAGGMGEVTLCRDLRIGRDVALKAQLGATSRDAVMAGRFLREARIQGQLEHPVVVPVYDLATRDDGRAFFTMKRVRGLALDAILAGLACNDPEITGKYSRRRLLSALAQVCLAVEFAHARGVIHRDIKPANIMLGDFGEVHLLDWGIAKVQDGPEPAVNPSESAAMSCPALGGATAHGTVLGTPGYMSPEQASGRIDQIDARTDVYSLGAVLFELLALEPLHRGRTAQEFLVSAMTGAEASPTRRGASDVPPELDVLCVRATQLDPASRCASAREMADAIERYLDGDRDLRLRRDLAQHHASLAAGALQRAGTGVGTEARAARSEALREVNRALALDPAHAEASRVLSSLFTDLPDDLPPEAEAELVRVLENARATAGKVGILRSAGLLLMVPVLLFWMGPRNLWLVAGLITAVAGAGVMNACWWKSRHGRMNAWCLHAAFALSAAMVLGLTTLFGPLVMVPLVAVLNGFLFSVQYGFRAKRGVVLVSALCIVVPCVLQLLGLVPASYTVEHDALVIHAQLTHYRAVPALGLLFGVGVISVAGPLLTLHRIQSALAANERAAFIRAWHLRQLVPTTQTVLTHGGAAT